MDSMVGVTGFEPATYTSRVSASAFIGIGAKRKIAHIEEEEEGRLRDALLNREEKLRFGRESFNRWRVARELHRGQHHISMTKTPKDEEGRSGR
jgi:hypothetical protein